MFDFNENSNTEETENDSVVSGGFDTFSGSSLEGGRKQRRSRRRGGRKQRRSQRRGGRKQRRSQRRSHKRNNMYGGEDDDVDDEDGQGGGVKRKNKGKKTRGKVSKWVKHVLKFARLHKIKYPAALKHPKCKAEYKKMS